VAILLFARLSLATNSLLKTVFIFIESYRCITLCICLSIISLASSRNWRGSICLEFITAPVRIRLSNAISMTRQQSPYPTPTYTNLPCTDFFRFSSRAIMRSDCLLLIDNRGRLIWLCSSNDSISSSAKKFQNWDFLYYFLIQYGALELCRNNICFIYKLYNVYLWNNSPQISSARRSNVDFLKLNLDVQLERYCYMKIYVYLHEILMYIIMYRRVNRLCVNAIYNMNIVFLLKTIGWKKKF